MRASIRAIFLLLFFATAATACDLRVAVTIAPQVEFVNAVGGSDVTVTVAVPPGSNPETFEMDWPTIKALSRAQAYFAIGDVPFEAANLDRIAKFNRDIRVYRPSYGNYSGEGYDHHVWMSPIAMVSQVNLIYTGLAKLCPDHAKQYRSNADRYIARLHHLDQGIIQTFRNKTQRTFIIDHPVLDIFAKRYGLTQLAIEKEGKEPTSAHLRDLLNQTQRLGIRTFFAQKAFNEITARHFAQSMHVTQLVWVDPFSPRYIENMQKMAGQLAQSMR